MTRRILSVILALIALAIAAFSVPAGLAIRSAQERGDLLELQRQAAIVASRLDVGQPLDDALLGPILQSDYRLGLYSPAGELLGGVGPQQGDSVVQAGLTGRFAEGRVGGDLVAAVPTRVRPAGSTFVVRIEAPNARSTRHLLGPIAELAAAAILIVLVATMVGLWLTRRMTRPIEDLRRWAEAPGGEGSPPDPTGIEELDSLRTTLLDDRARIAELLASERAFSSHVSHQLRTPVAAMRVAIETELDVPRADRAAVLAECLPQLDRLESTITSLLSLARHNVRHDPIELFELVERRVARWRTVVGSRSIELAGGPAEVVADGEAIGHIIDVLIDNAVRHGHGTISIRVGAEGTASFVEVGDEGTSSSERTSTEPTGADMGHGIGLGLARTLSAANGGTIDLLETATTTYRLTLTSAERPTT